MLLLDWPEWLLSCCHLTHMLLCLLCTSYCLVSPIHPCPLFSIKLDYRYGCTPATLQWVHTCCSALHVAGWVGLLLTISISAVVCSSLCRLRLVFVTSSNLLQSLSLPPYSIAHLCSGWVAATLSCCISNQLVTRLTIISSHVGHIVTLSGWKKSEYWSKFQSILFLIAKWCHLLNDLSFRIIRILLWLHDLEYLCCICRHYTGAMNRLKSLRIWREASGGVPNRLEMNAIFRSNLKIALCGG